uniref:Putative secreted protein n=1 Tax=Panstrongylus lignarius TaxID=156445 RepID=A0A224Y763_9HEMI
MLVLLILVLLCAVVSFSLPWRFLLLRHLHCSHLLPMYCKLVLRSCLEKDLLRPCTLLSTMKVHLWLK